MYNALVCRASNIRNHPNADKLNLATVSGYQVIVGKDILEGTLGIFFPSDGCLSYDMAYQNKLYRKDPTTNLEMGGYLEENRRVKVLKLRGEKSEGYWTKLESLSWCLGDLSSLKEGMELDTFNGKKLCHKYINPATLRAFKEKGSNTEKKIRYNASIMFKEHYDTPQLKNNLHKLTKGSIVSVSLKLHGTSQRTGRVKTLRRLNFLEKFLFRLGFKIDIHEWKYLSGTRRTTMDADANNVDTGYYSGSSFRHKIHERIKTLGLKKGETLYYEVVGYTDTGASIMPPHANKEKDLKMYPENMYYSYGCSQEKKECEIYVYRITHSTEDGQQIDLSIDQVKVRCNELGLKFPPELTRFIIENQTQEELLEQLEVLSDGPDPIDGSHVREGICVRVENDQGSQIYKLKGYYFRLLEGLIKDKEDYIDTEELESLNLPGES